jgi:hypothetical protein
VETFDALVIGAGQSGLAAARALREAGAEPVVLEAASEPGGSWPHYYDSLTLFSPARYSALPGLPFPGDPGRYPRREEVTAYLRDYAARLDADIRTGSRVTAVTADGPFLAARLATGEELRARAVIAATGSFSRPHVPSLPGLEQFTGTLIHASRYRSPSPFAGKDVIVVGAGNSAVQIAAELAASAAVTLATRRPVRYSGNSVANSTIVAPDAKTSVASDTAGENLFGRNVHYEPTGPKPLAKSASGQELYPGPGYNSYVDRPANCVAQTVPAKPAGTCLLGGGSNPPGARTDASAAAPSGSTVIADNAAVATDKGRSVSGNGIPAGAYVGAVTDTPVTATKSNQDGGTVDTGSFTLVGASGKPVATTGPVSGVTLGAETPATDPLYDNGDATNGGGDTGSVLISPYIRPGSVSTTYYNHYSWLRTIEDLFSVSKASPGLDGQGHLGYAAQPGLAPFGTDVFTNPRGYGNGGGPHSTGGVLAAGAFGLLAVGAVPVAGRYRRRRRAAGKQ